MENAKLLCRCALTAERSRGTTNRERRSTNSSDRFACLGFSTLMEMFTRLGSTAPIWPKHRAIRNHRLRSRLLFVISSRDFRRDVIFCFNASRDNVKKHAWT